MIIDIKPIERPLEASKFSFSYIHSDVFYRFETELGNPITIMFTPEELTSWKRDWTVSKYIKTTEAENKTEAEGWLDASKTGNHPFKGDYEKAEDGYYWHTWGRGESEKRIRYKKTSKWIPSKVDKNTALVLYNEKAKRLGRIVLVKYIRDLNK